MGLTLVNLAPSGQEESWEGMFYPQGKCQQPLEKRDVLNQNDGGGPICLTGDNLVFKPVYFLCLAQLLLEVFAFGKNKKDFGVVLPPFLSELEKG